MAESDQQQRMIHNDSNADIPDDGTPPGGLVRATDGSETASGANPISSTAGAAAAPTISTAPRSTPASDEVQLDESGGLSRPATANQGTPVAGSSDEDRSDAVILPGDGSVAGEGYQRGSLANPGAKSGRSTEAPSILTDPRAGTDK